MKKLKLILVSLGLLLAFISSAQTLSFRLTNPQIMYYTTASGVPVNGEYFEFDVEVKASTLQYFYSGQIVLSFNTSSLSSSTGAWVVTPGDLFSGSNSDLNPKYLILPKTIFEGEFTIPFAADPSSLNRDPYTPGDFNQISTADFETMFNIKVLRNGESTGMAGIDFVEAFMDGQFSYMTGISTYAGYVNPNVYDPADFSTTYLGRIYANSTWTQTGGSTNGVAYLDWATAVNTSVWDGTPTLTGGAELIVSALRVHSPATLTIPVDGKLTVSGATDILTTNGLNILSDATGTGSLITGSASGSATAQRWMTTGAWHQVSPPLAGQLVADFLTAAGNVTNIATKNTTDRAMMNYNTSDNTWSAFYTNGSGGTLAAGLGYMMRTDADAAVNFAGTLTAGSPTVTLSGAGDTGWNLIGNPYSSAIDLNSEDGTDFLAANPAGSILDASSLGIYVWNQVAEKYDVINWAEAADVASLGQAFFVKSYVDAATVHFNTAMQLHSPAVLKSVKSAYPEIKLIAANDGKNVSTSIKFIAGTSNGLDPGYDAGLFSLGSTVSLFTKLVQDNGVNFMLQCLPDNNYNSLIIPVGITSPAGGAVVFSAEAINLSADCKIILEDNLLKKFTDLTKNTYTVTIDDNSGVSDRFRIHTSYLTTGLNIGNGEGIANRLSAWSILNTEIRISGSVGKQAIATLYDIQGRVVLIKNLEEGTLNIMATPNLRTGIYLLSVKENNRVQEFKIPVNQ